MFSFVFLPVSLLDIHIFLPLETVIRWSLIFVQRTELSRDVYLVSRRFSKAPTAHGSEIELLVSGAAEEIAIVAKNVEGAGTFGLSRLPKVALVSEGMVVGSTFPSCFTHLAVNVRNI